MMAFGVSFYFSDWGFIMLYDDGSRVDEWLMGWTFFSRRRYHLFGESYWAVVRLPLFLQCAQKHDEREVKGQNVKLTSVTTPVCSCVTVTMHLLSNYHHAYLFIFLMQRVKRNFGYFLTTQL